MLLAPEDLKQASTQELQAVVALIEQILDGREVPDGQDRLIDKDPTDPGYDEPLV